MKACVCTALPSVCSFQQVLRWVHYPKRIFLLNHRRRASLLRVSLWLTHGQILQGRKPFSRVGEITFLTFYFLSLDVSGLDTDGPGFKVYWGKAGLK